ncbi:MAG: relaxase/mobilization nuclease domain-containing protein, partial [Candidatus Thermoplasmatota archaeon]
MSDKGNPERVQYVYSTFVGGTDKKGIASELKLFKGKAYDGLATRISFSPNDRKLTEAEFKQFCDIVQKEYLGARNFIAIMHGDTEHQHIHIISTFLDANNKPLNFSGKAKYREAIRQQGAVDKACRELNLSTLPREEKKYNSREGIPGYKYRGERVTKAEKVGKQPWRVETKKHIRECESIEDLERRGVKIVRESEETLTLEYAGKKMRLNRLFPQLRTRADLEAYIAE